MSGHSKWANIKNKKAHQIAYHLFQFCQEKTKCFILMEQYTVSVVEYKKTEFTGLI